MITWLGAWIPIVFIVLATRHYRNYENGGVLSYSQGYSTGLLTAVCAGFLFALIIYSFGTIIDGSIVDRFKTENMAYLEQTAELSQSMFGEKMYDDAIANIEKTTIGTLASQEFYNKAMGGFIVAFITAAIFKRKIPLVPYDGQQN